MQKAFAVIANVDGNLDALRAVLADIDARDVTETLSLGNLVGTGLEPAACIDLVFERATAIVRGCYDQAVIEGSWDSHERWCHRLGVRAALRWSRQQLCAPGGAERWSRYASLPLRIKRGPDLFVHGTRADPIHGGGFAARDFGLFAGFGRFLFSSHGKEAWEGLIARPGPTTPAFDPNSLNWGAEDEDWDGIGLWDAANLRTTRSFTYAWHPAVIRVGAVGDAEARYVLVEGDTVTWRRVPYDHQRLDSLRRARTLALLSQRDVGDDDLEHALLLAEDLGLREAIPAITTLLRDTSWDLCSSACTALGSLRAAEAIPELVDLLRDGALHTRGIREPDGGPVSETGRTSLILRAISALRELEAQEAIPAILAYRDDAWPWVRRAAQTALKELGYRPEAAERRFLRMVDAGEAGARLAYAHWLEEHGQPTRAEYLRLCEKQDDEARSRRAELEPRLGRWGLRVKPH